MAMTLKLEPSLLRAARAYGHLYSTALKLNTQNSSNKFEVPKGLK